MATVVEEKKVQADEANKPQGEKVSPIKFLKEVKTEFFKISWPTKDQVSKEFISVIILVAILTGSIYVIDKIFEVIANYFMGK
jgi:preprotein translocase subunit SecE